jgi:hypothetical protein
MWREEWLKMGSKEKKQRGPRKEKMKGFRI